MEDVGYYDGVDYDGYDDDVCCDMSRTNKIKTFNRNDKSGIDTVVRCNTGNLKQSRDLAKPQQTSYLLYPAKDCKQSFNYQLTGDTKIPMKMKNRNKKSANGRRQCNIRSRSTAASKVVSVAASISTQRPGAGATVAAATHVQRKAVKTGKTKKRMDRKSKRKVTYIINDSIFGKKHHNTAKSIDRDLFNLKTQNRSLLQDLCSNTYPTKDCQKMINCLVDNLYVENNLTERLLSIDEKLQSQLSYENLSHFNNFVTKSSININSLNSFYNNLLEKADDFLYTNTRTSDQKIKLNAHTPNIINIILGKIFHETQQTFRENIYKYEKNRNEYINEMQSYKVDDISVSCDDFYNQINESCLYDSIVDLPTIVQSIESSIMLPEVTYNNNNNSIDMDISDFENDGSREVANFQCTSCNVLRLDICQLIQNYTTTATDSCFYKDFNLDTYPKICDELSKICTIEEILMLLKFNDIPPENFNLFFQIHSSKSVNQFIYNRTREKMLDKHRTINGFTKVNHKTKDNGAFLSDKECEYYYFNENSKIILNSQTYRKLIYSLYNHDYADCNLVDNSIIKESGTVNVTDIARSTDKRILKFDYNNVRIDLDDLESIYNSTVSRYYWFNYVNNYVSNEIENIPDSINDIYNEAKFVLEKLDYIYTDTTLCTESNSISATISESVFDTNINGDDINGKYPEMDNKFTPIGDSIMDHFLLWVTKSEIDLGVSFYENKKTDKNNCEPTSSGYSSAGSPSSPSSQVSKKRILKRHLTNNSETISRNNASNTKQKDQQKQQPRYRSKRLKSLHSNDECLKKLFINKHRTEYDNFKTFQRLFLNIQKNKFDDLNCFKKSWCESCYKLKISDNFLSERICSKISKRIDKSITCNNIDKNDVKKNEQFNRIIDFSNLSISLFFYLCYETFNEFNANLTKSSAKFSVTNKYHKHVDYMSSKRYYVLESIRQVLFTVFCIRERMYDDTISTLNRDTNESKFKCTFKLLDYECDSDFKFLKELKNLTNITKSANNTNYQESYAATFNVNSTNNINLLDKLNGFKKFLNYTCELELFDNFNLIPINADVLRRDFFEKLLDNEILVLDLGIANRNVLINDYNVRIKKFDEILARREVVLIVLDKCKEAIENFLLSKESFGDDNIFESQHKQLVKECYDAFQMFNYLNSIVDFYKYYVK